jgi:hypothetical protein
VPESNLEMLNFLKKNYFVAIDLIPGRFNYTRDDAIRMEFVHEDCEQTVWDDPILQLFNPE